MGEGRWRAVRIGEIPTLGAAANPSFWQEWARDPDFGRGWHSIREFLEIAGFGVNASEAPAGKELIVPHSEVEFGGQEELYIVLRGSVRFVCDGEEVELGPGELLYAGPEVTREARALETPTVVVAIGGTPGKAYEVPRWDEG